MDASAYTFLYLPYIGDVITSYIFLAVCGDLLAKSQVFHFDSLSTNAGAATLLYNWIILCFDSVTLR